VLGKALIFFFNLKQFCFVSYRYLNLYDTISFVVLVCRVLIVLYGVLTLYCVFETCKVTSVLKLYFERYSFTFHFTKFLSHFLNKLMLNRNYFLILSVVKKSVSHCAYIPSRNREKQLCNKAIKSHQKTF
jgi:hypothetical protein